MFLINIHLNKINLKTLFDLYENFPALVIWSPCCLQALACCAGVRFRLLLLALQHCRQTQRHGRYLQGQTCPGHIALLFDRILATALQTFRAPPAWYGKWSKEQAR